jgi:hypothetical protein
MAKAKRKPTPNEPSKASSDWLSLEDVFQRWRARLGLSHEAVDELKALLRHRETRSVSRRVDARGKEIPGTRGLVDIGFWPNHASDLSVIPDADAVGDCLGVNYTNYVDAYSVPDERTEFFVRRLDVERHEGLYFPAISAPPPVVQAAPDQPPEGKAGRDPVEAGVDDVERAEGLCPATVAPPPRAAKGPVPGEIDRYGEVDRALFPEIERLMKLQSLTITEAVRQIPEKQLAGRGALESRIRRVSDRYREEKQEKP